MDRKLLYYKTQIQILRGYSTCFIMTGFNNNERNTVMIEIMSLLYYENKYNMKYLQIEQKKSSHKLTKTK